MRMGLNKNGIMVMRNNDINVNAQVKVLRTPSNALHRINKIKENQPLNILVKRIAGGIGDVLMTLPTVRAIKEKYDIERLDYVTDFDYLNGALKKVLLHNPDITNIIDYRLLPNEYLESYDAVIDLTCPCVAHEQPHALSINRIDLFARHAGIGLTDTSIPYYTTTDETNWANIWLADKQLDKFIIVQANSSTSNRDLPLLTLQRSVMAILQQMPGYKAIVITHGDYLNDWDLYNVVRFHNYDVRHIAAIMQYAELVMCQDSSILHLAGALKKKIVSFFGPTDPNARIDHYENAIAICNSFRLKCFWCWYNHQACNNRMTCWSMIKEDMIIQPTLQILKNEPLQEAEYIVSFGRFSNDSTIKSKKFITL